MNREDIIRMAREAGFHCYNGCADGIDADLERFAALVAAEMRCIHCDYERQPTDDELAAHGIKGDA